MYSYFTPTDLSGYSVTKANLLSILDRTTIPPVPRGNLYRRPDGTVGYVSQRADVIGTIGRTTNFGYGKIRHRGYAEFVNNKRKPELYKALVHYAEKALPEDFHWNTITLNKDVKAKRHTDGQNVGDSFIIGFGDYQGGYLRTYTNETDYIAHDIKDRALKFNGAFVPHETEDFTGTRYTIIFYKQNKEDLPKPKSSDFPDA